jgi:hypothetical protein
MIVANMHFFEYDGDMINFVGNIVYENCWTKQKQNALIKTLIKYIPMDPINEIIKHAKTFGEYLYYIPLDGVNCCDLNGDIVLSFCEVFNGFVYMACEGELKYRNRHIEN